MRNLNWFQARDLAETGSPIRREAWRKWLTRGYALWFIYRQDEDGTALHYVVPREEFQRAEFLAHDWTDEPWDTGSGSGSGGSSGGTDDGSGGGDGGTGGGDPGGGGPVIIVDYWPPLGGGDPGPGGHRRHGGSHGGRSWGGPSNPPGPGGGGGGGGDGGGGGTSERPRPHPPHDHSPAATVTVTVTPHDTLPACYDIPLETPPATVELDVEVSIEGGPPGVGTVSVTLGGETQLGTLSRGGNQSFAFMTVTFALGGTVTATATYTIFGTPANGSGDYTFPNDCAVSSGGGPGP